MWNTFINILRPIALNIMSIVPDEDQETHTPVEVKREMQNCSVVYVFCLGKGGK